MSYLFDILNAEGPLAKALSYIFILIVLACILIAVAYFGYEDEFYRLLNQAIDFIKSFG